MKPIIVYHSLSGNTKAFVQKLDAVSIAAEDLDWDTLTTPIIIVTPTYSDGTGAHAIPKIWEVIIDNPKLHHLVVGVVSCGDRAFINTFCLGGKKLAKKLDTHVLREVELRGLPSDVRHVQGIIDQC